MEPWQQEALHRLQLERKPRPLCRCCGEPIETELCLDLEPFGIRAVACEDCVNRQLVVRRQYV